MRKHKGAHPRMGATDVCPFIPVSNVSWNEAIACAQKLGERVGNELKIPVYLYEKAASDKSRANLSVIRAGEYEGFFQKIKQPEWKPDFGPAIFNEKSGATVIGVRDFLVAYNVNLNTKSVRRANSVAFDVREQGRVKTVDGTPWGKPVLDSSGEPLRELGMLKHDTAAKRKSLVKMNLREFGNDTLSDSPAPGGGSVAALMGALGASLGGMVANLSAGKRGWDDRLEYFSGWAVQAQQLKDELLALVEDDTAAFNKVMDAFALPKESAEERAARSAAVEEATKYAAEVPLKVMETDSKSYQLLSEMAERGNPASISDVGVGALATRACIEGAELNVRINLGQLKDEKFRSALLEKVQKVSSDSKAQFSKITEVVESKLR